MEIQTQSYSSVQNSYDEAVEWLNRIGVRVNRGRLGEYRKHLDSFVLNYNGLSGAESKDQFSKTVNVMYEVDAIIHIYEALKSSTLDQLSYIKTKLQQAVAGPLHASDENKNGNKARNYLFEIMVSAKLHAPDKGMCVDLSSKSDTEVSFLDKRFLVECKRPQSEKKIEANFRDAVAQLIKKFKNSRKTNVRGLVAIDFSKIVNPDADLLVKDNDRELQVSSMSIIDYVIKKYSHKWQDILSRKSKKILGVIVRASLMGVSEERNLLVNCNEWGLNPRIGCTPIESEYLRQMVLSLDYKQRLIIT
ncbi:MAG: hypothetical protein J7K30_14685 [Deltaproteobacteria bacterium]|nr:hypothetical protein [Deltaproteobacteria bacterium]